MGAMVYTRARARVVGGVGAAAVTLLAACSSDPVSVPAKARVLSPVSASLGFIARTGNRTANFEVLEVCKDYPNVAVPPATTDFTLSVNGSTYTFSLAPGECRDVWELGGSASAPDQVTVTETVPAGFTSTYQVTTIVKGPITSTGAVTDGNQVTVSIGASNLDGALVVFTNTLIPVTESAEGRMTGGGFRVGDVKVTGGLTLHCDITLSNNLEVNWGKNKWHLDKPITKALCLDDPNVDPTSPVAPFDTFIGEGMGRLNGVDGSLAKFTFVDAGEPGRNDMVKLEIWDASGTLVLDLPLSKLDIGNLQAHYDQPHGNKP